MPFSDGLDSRAVAGLMTREMGSELLRVRLGTKDYDARDRGRPFQAVPYKNRGTRMPSISKVAEGVLLIDMNAGDPSFS